MKTGVILRSKRGFGLIEVLVAFGLMAGLTLTMLQLMEHNGKSARNLNFGVAVVGLHTQLIQVLSDVGCPVNFGSRFSTFRLSSPKAGDKMNLPQLGLSFPSCKLLPDGSKDCVPGPPLLFYNANDPAATKADLIRRQNIVEVVQESNLSPELVVKQVNPTLDQSKNSVAAELNLYLIDPTQRDTQGKLKLGMAKRVSIPIQFVANAQGEVLDCSTSARIPTGGGDSPGTCTDANNCTIPIAGKCPVGTTLAGDHCIKNSEQTILLSNYVDESGDHGSAFYSNGNWEFSCPFNTYPLLVGIGSYDMNQKTFKLRCASDFEWDSNANRGVQTFESAPNPDGGDDDLNFISNDRLMVSCPSYYSLRGWKQRRPMRSDKVSFEPDCRDSSDKDIYGGNTDFGKKVGRILTFENGKHECRTCWGINPPFDGFESDPQMSKRSVSGRCPDGTFLYGLRQIASMDTSAMNQFNGAPDILWLRIELLCREYKNAPSIANANSCEGRTRMMNGASSKLCTDRGGTLVPLPAAGNECVCTFPKPPGASESYYYINSNRMYENARTVNVDGQSISVPSWQSYYCKNHFMNYGPADSGPYCIYEQEDRFGIE